jgi:hypothetical protein
MQQLWLRMAEIYGVRWTSSYGDDPSKGAAQTWAKGLAGLSGDQLARGLSSCIASAETWPPTLPEFRMHCVGIPPLAAVRADIGKQDGFTRLVWQHLDGHRYRHASSDQADKLLREAYEQAKEFVMRGGDLPPPPAGEIEQEQKLNVPATKEQVARHFDDIAAILGGSSQ